MERSISKGFYLAGFLSYEAGYAFEKVLQKKEVFDFPLLCFGIYNGYGKGNEARFGNVKTDVGRKTLPLDDTGIVTQTDPPFNLSQPQYHDKINKIKEYIAKGDTYQITFCVKKRFDHKGDTYALYKKLLNYQPVPYPAYIKHEDFDLLSLSPEMFLKKTNREIIVKPMKGTLLRDGSFINNIYGKTWLHRDPKNRAENIMITDLLRNDLGRICDKGSVKTTKLCEVAKYRTVYQMTSTVKGNTNKEIPIYDVFKALFPSGSVTGAPKIRAMEIIRELEEEERNIYTGAIGYSTPNRDMFFNVPIRTILIQHCWDFEVGSWDFSDEMGIGGGITWYSTPEGEYDECVIKARFLDVANI
ncbi:anthranilate synthase component I family protein [Candidatus Saganbacteria bacterium]|nr:anthranilate synthase component I family protein [Candidatus Saganbacteria bacterium]